MARTTSPSHTQNGDATQPQSLSSSTALTMVEPPQPRPMTMVEPPQPRPMPSTTTIVELVMKVITLVSLIVSTSVLASNSAMIINLLGNPAVVRFSDIISYRYVLSTSILGLVYTLLQLPSSIHHVHWGKPLATHPNYPVFYFLAEKIFLALLATGAGAAFGVTIDLKHNLDVFENFLEYEEITDYALTRIKLDDFFNRAYVPATFLLIAVITTGVSSVISSLALIKKPRGII